MIGATASAKRTARTRRRQCKQRTFDKQLLYEPGSTRADRQPQRHLPLSRGCPRGQQVCDIRAGDQQHQADDGRKDPQRPLERFSQRRWSIRGGSDKEWCAQVLFAQSPRLVGPEPAEPFAANGSEHRLQDRARIVRPDTWPQPSERAEPLPADFVQGIAIAHHHRQPDVGANAGLESGERRPRRRR